MKTGKKRVSLLQIFRFLAQIAFFILLPGFYANAFAGIKVIYTGLLNHTFSLSRDLPQLMETFSVIPATFLLGRFFCGWMCAFGTLGDILYMLSSKVFRVTFRISEKADRVMKYFKYGVFVFIVVVGWTLGNTALTNANPWNVFGVLATFGKTPDFSFAITEFSAGFFLLLAIVTASMFIERFFCRYLCPLGAVFSILSRLKLVKVIKPTNQCGNCKACTRSCVMGMPLYKTDVVESGECIGCMKCVTICPRNNAHVNLGANKLMPVIASVLAVFVITGIYLSGSFFSKVAVGSTAVNTPTAVVSQAVSSSEYKDGTYEGMGTGFRGAQTTVLVTLQNGEITDIQVTAYGDDYSYISRAYSSIANDILNSQTTDVDTVSGATFSSRGIISAVRDALNKAES